jgi:invasion protein IalB
MSRVAMLCTLALLSVGLGAQTSPGATKVEKTFGAWTVTCIENTGTKHCTLYEQLATQKKQVVFVWSIGANAQKEMVNSVAVLGGVSVKEGIRVSIGNAAPKLVAYDICGGRGCIANFPLDAATLQAMSSSPQISANYVQASRKLVQLKVDLKDFPKAYEYFKSQQ